MNEIGVGGPPVSGVVYIYIIRIEREWYTERLSYRSEKERRRLNILYIYTRAGEGGKGWKSVMEVEILNSPVSINNTTVEAI